jgi:hypothetical protein
MPQATTDPAWLVRLRRALFSQPGFPVQDDQFEADGDTYVCQRRLDDDGARLLFRETWLDPYTLRPQKTWTQEVDAASFVGPLPETVFNQMVVQLALWLTAARPRKPVRRQVPTFDPYRFTRNRPGPGGRV